MRCVAFLWLFLPFQTSWKMAFVHAEKSTWISFLYDAFRDFLLKSTLVTSTSKKALRQQADFSHFLWKAEKNKPVRKKTLSGMTKLSKETFKWKFSHTGFLKHNALPACTEFAVLAALPTNAEKDKAVNKSPKQSASRTTCSFRLGVLLHPSSCSQEWLQGASSCCQTEIRFVKDWKNSSPLAQALCTSLESPSSSAHS